MLNDLEIRVIRELIQKEKLNIISKNLDRKNVSLDDKTISIMSALTKIDEKLFSSYSAAKQQEIVKNNELTLNQ